MSLLIWPGKYRATKQPASTAFVTTQQDLGTNTEYQTEQKISVDGGWWWGVVSPAVADYNPKCIGYYITALFFSLVRMMIEDSRMKTQTEYHNGTR